MPKLSFLGLGSVQRKKLTEKGLAALYFSFFPAGKVVEQELRQRKETPRITDYHPSFESWMSK